MLCHIVPLAVLVRIIFGVSNEYLRYMEGITIDMICPDHHLKHATQHHIPSQHVEDLQGNIHVLEHMDRLAHNIIQEMGA